MKCPYCSTPDSKVVDSSPTEDAEKIRRRRECLECGKRFTTYEKIETIPLIIIKKDDNRETYERSKIEGGVLRACHKRPVSAQQITQLGDFSNAQSTVLSDNCRTGIFHLVCNLGDDIFLAF